MWAVLGAWIFAALVAVVVLGFCAYEIAGKAKRLQGDLAQLQALETQFAQLQGGLAAAQARIAAVGTD